MLFKQGMLSSRLKNLKDEKPKGRPESPNSARLLIGKDAGGPIICESSFTGEPIVEHARRPNEHSIIETE